LVVLVLLLVLVLLAYSVSFLQGVVCVLISICNFGMFNCAAGRR
jgi:hypothetical protein